LKFEALTLLEKLENVDRDEEEGLSSPPVRMDLRFKKAFVGGP
jgi:hypothetical protein